MFFALFVYMSLINLLKLISGRKTLLSSGRGQCYTRSVGLFDVRFSWIVAVIFCTPFVCSPCSVNRNGCAWQPVKVNKSAIGSYRRSESGRSMKVFSKYFSVRISWLLSTRTPLVESDVFATQKVHQTMLQTHNWSNSLPERTNSHWKILWKHSTAFRPPITADRWFVYFYLWRHFR